MPSLAAQGLLWWLCCAGVPALAEPAAAYGGEFRRQEQHQEATQPQGAGVPGPALSAADVDRLEQQLEQLELAGGPYAIGLSEPLESLARHYREQGQLESATALYQRALHILRINDGLYSPSQQPLVRSLMELARSGGDLEQLDDRYGYFFRLYGNGQPPYTGLRLDAALEYLRWQREAISLELDGSSERRLLLLYELNDEMLDAVTTSSGVSPQQYWRLLQSQLRNFYLLAANWQPSADEFGVARGLRPYTAPPQELDPNQQRLATIQRSAGNRINTLLASYQAMLAADDYLQRARAELALGDWYQWNESWRRAEGHYQEAISQLQLLGDEERIQRWFGEPTELPDNGAFQRASSGEDPTPVVLQASFEVSGQGRSKSVTVREGDAGARKAQRLRRLLLDTRFRPRFEAGHAVASDPLVRDYQLQD